MIFPDFDNMEVIKGADIVTNIHDALYNNEFSICDLGMQYVPHITVGKTSNIEELNKAYEDIKDNRCRFVSVIDKISSNE